MRERNAVLSALKVFDEGSFLERLNVVRDAYANHCAEYLANDREDAAKEYAKIYLYCTKLIDVYRKRWDALNMPKAEGRQL
jgi:hypothetical protein